MSTSLLALTRAIGKELGYITGLPSAAGSTTTIVDISTDSPLDTEDSTPLYQNAWAKIEADSAATPLNVGEVRRVKTYAPSTGTITVSRAFTNATTVTMTYGIYFGMPPARTGTFKGLVEYVNDTLRALYHRRRYLLTLVTDGDMEATGVTSWTANNATLTKITTTGYVGLGKQSMRVLNSSLSGGAISGTVAVTQGQSLYARADLKVISGTGRLQLYDNTNDAEITTKRSSERSWRYVYLTGQVPSACKLVTVRLVGVEATADVYWDNVSLRYGGAKRMDLPSWVVNPHSIEEIELWAGGGSYDESHAIDESYRDAVHWWEVIMDPTEATAGRIEFWPQTRADELMLLRAIRPFAELSADTDTTDANADLVVAGVMVRIYNDRTDDESRKKLAIWMPRYAQLLNTHQPVFSKRLTIRPY